MPDSDARPLLSTRARVALHLGFLPAGAAQALYGPSLSAIAARFEVTVGTAGLLIGAHGVGALVGVVLWAALQHRAGLRRIVAAAAAALAAGTALLAVAPTWPLMIVGALVTGCGFGALAIGLNVYISNALGTRSAPVLTSTAAAFGLGAISAPAALALVGPPRHAIVLLGVCAVALAALPLLLASEDPPPSAVAERGRRRPSRLTVLFTVAIGLYVSLEVGIGGWQATHLEGLGYDAAAAARWTAAFWASFTVGRILATPLAAHASVVALSLGAVVVAAAALAATSAGAVAGGLAVVGYVAAGLALAPVFPATFGWFARATATTSLSTALFFIAGSVGGALLPPAIGLLVDRSGPAAIPLALSGVAALCGLTLTVIRGRAPVSAPERTW